MNYRERQLTRQRNNLEIEIARLNKKIERLIAEKQALLEYDPALCDATERLYDEGKAEAKGDPITL